MLRAAVATHVYGCIFTNVAAGAEELALSLSWALHTPHLSLWLIQHYLFSCFEHYQYTVNIIFFINILY